MPLPAAGRLLLVVAIALPSLTCGSTVDPFDAEGTGDRILFVGNSLTENGNIPGIVQALAAARGHEIAVARITRPDYALQDHWAEGFVNEQIARGEWATIVLQQGPSSGAVARDSLRIMARVYANAAAPSGARIALYATWPQSSRRFDLAAAAESYRLAAADVGGLLMPVSRAWAETWNRDPAIQLYSDALHASDAGAYLAAIVIYARLFDDSPVGLPATVEARNGYRISLAAAVAATLQAAAAAAIAAP